jgi:hypothetical protein
MTVSFSYLENLIDRADEVMGKKLTTKDRKKMKKSTFCGPNRSFPVPDCQHVATAKAYLGRSKFSKSTKERIAACINRKAKQLGCSVSKKAKADVDFLEELKNCSYAKLKKEEKKIYMSDVFTTTRELVEESIKNPGMDLFEEPESTSD